MGLAREVVAISALSSQARCRIKVDRLEPASFITPAQPFVPPNCGGSHFGSGHVARVTTMQPEEIMHTLAAAVTVLQLVIGPEANLADMAVPDLLREIRAIWAPVLQVVLEPATAPPRDRAIRLMLRTEDRPGRPADHVDRSHTPALGWIEFVDGVPKPVITVSVARARVSVNGAVVAGRLVQELPPAVSHRLTAVALGRAIAHEIGHYLLQSTAHSRTGLMRAGFSPRELTARSTAGLQLSPAERQRIASRLAAPVWAGATKPETSALW